MSNVARRIRRQPTRVPMPECQRAGNMPMLDPNRMRQEQEALVALERQQKANEHLLVAQLAAQIVMAQNVPEDVRESAGALLRRVFDWGFDAAHGAPEAQS